MLAKNPKFHKRTKNNDICYRFVRERVVEEQIVLEYFPTKDMKANLMTKRIAVVQVQSLRNMLGIMAPRSAEMSGSVVDEAPRPESGNRTVRLDD